MASSSNGARNLVDDFEESFQECVHALTKQESSTGVEKDEINMEVDLTTMKFIDLARQMESFFIQKRFVLSCLKPQWVIKEENLDLKLEIARKDEMIKKHYERIEHWKNMLSDTQQQQQHQYLPHPPQPSSIPPQIAPGMAPPGLMNTSNMPMPGHAGPSSMQMPVPGMPMVDGSAQKFMQQGGQMNVPNIQQMQAQQMHMQQMQVGGTPQMFMQQGGPMNVVRGSVPAGMQMGNFGPPPNQIPLAGPLAYLEKTTSNIGNIKKKSKK